MRLTRAHRRGGARPDLVRDLTQELGMSLTRAHLRRGACRRVHLRAHQGELVRELIQELGMNMTRAHLRRGARPGAQEELTEEAETAQELLESSSKRSARARQTHLRRAWQEFTLRRVACPRAQQELIGEGGAWPRTHPRAHPRTWHEPDKSSPEKRSSYASSCERFTKRNSSRSSSESSFTSSA